MISIRQFMVSAALALSAVSFDVAAGIAVVDMTARNRENEISGDWSRSLYSARYMCDIAGYDYVVTPDVDEAVKHDMILFSNCITSDSFDRAEWEKLSGWVNGGGVILSPALRSVGNDSKDIVGDLFGVDTAETVRKSNSRKIIHWNPDCFADPELEYIDEENERATSIGEVKSFSLAAREADVLASFDTGGAAVTRNSYGAGKAYIASVTWRDVIQRNQLNKDLGASREYNNGFEPSSDVWALFMRSIYAASHPVSVWKFTVPGGYTQLLVPTHDCDSRTAYDEMHFMSDYEKSLGFSGHYFLTVHYFSDKLNFGHSYLSDFYNETTVEMARRLLTDGHTVGSHSICHFPDFNKTRNTDVVTRDEYAHRATCVDGVSTGASTWAEIVMSKQILRDDLKNDVRSFRSGHLCVNPDFHAMMELGDYEFQSCFTGGDILSEFPFFGRINNQWEGNLSNVLTMQLHISDVYNNKAGAMPLNDDTWSTHPAPDDWYESMRKLRGNYASAVLLIHPNREWKMTLQKKLVDRLDHAEVAMYNFEDYGDFWISRLNTGYSYCFDSADGMLTVFADTDSLAASKLTFAVEVSDGAISGARIKSFDGGQTLEADLRKIADNRYLVIPKIYEYGAGGAVGQLHGATVSFDAVYDLHGRMVLTGEDVGGARDMLPSGIYIIRSGKSASKLKI